VAAHLACAPSRAPAQHGLSVIVMAACWLAVGPMLAPREAFAADADTAPRTAEAVARRVPAGIAVIRELTRDTGSISLTSDKGEDLVAVVTGAADHLEGSRKNAFGYGESHDVTARCLLVSVHPDPTKPASEWRHWLLCGQSPALVLQPETPPEGMNSLVKRLRHDTASRTLPAYLKRTILGDALILQTEGGDGALYFSKDGPVWTELPGGE